MTRNSMNLKKLQRPDRSVVLYIVPLFRVARLCALLHDNRARMR
jgi:hypothetical protein